MGLFSLVLLCNGVVTVPSLDGIICCAQIMSWFASEESLDTLWPRNIPEGVGTFQVTDMSSFGLLIVWNHPWCTLMKDWKWLVELTCKGWPGHQSHSEVIMPSLKMELLHSWSIWCTTGAKNISMDFWTSQLGLHQALALVLGTLRYEPYWRAVFHVSHIQVGQTWKKLLWCHSTFSVKTGEEVIHFSWRV